MENNELPINQTLTQILVAYDPLSANPKTHLDKVVLILGAGLRTLVVEPLPDTDEINITSFSNNEDDRLESPLWGSEFEDKKLQMVWVCQNNQGYQDLVIFAFGNLKPDIGFLCEGSVLKMITFNMD